MRLYTEPGNNTALITSALLNHADLDQGNGAEWHLGRAVYSVGRHLARDYMAESEGFEPSIPYGIHTFQACAFDHSASSPWARSLAQPLAADTPCDD